MGRIRKDGIVFHEPPADRCEIIQQGGKTENDEEDTYILFPEGINEVIREQQNSLPPTEHSLFPNWDEDKAVQHIQRVAQLEKWPSGFVYDVHSLTHGGEQALERAGKILQDIRTLGRWAANSTALSD